eukprot:scaffold193563_cov29-Tisochrysis_lutea.AAC.2
MSETSSSILPPRCPSKGSTIVGGHDAWPTATWVERGTPEGSNETDCKGTGRTEPSTTWDAPTLSRISSSETAAAQSSRADEPAPEGDKMLGATAIREVLLGSCATRETRSDGEQNEQHQQKRSNGRQEGPQPSRCLCCRRRRRDKWSHEQKVSCPGRALITRGSDNNVGHQVGVHIAEDSNRAPIAAARARIWAR